MGVGCHKDIVWKLGWAVVCWRKVANTILVQRFRSLHRKDHTIFIVISSFDLNDTMSLKSITWGVDLQIPWFTVTGGTSLWGWPVAAASEAIWRGHVADFGIFGFGWRVCQKYPSDIWLPLTAGLCGIIYHPALKARQLVLSLVEALGPQHPRSASARRHQLYLEKNLWDSESSRVLHPFDSWFAHLFTCRLFLFAVPNYHWLGPTHSFPLGSRLLHMQSHVQCIEEDWFYRWIVLP